MYQVRGGITMTELQVLTAGKLEDGMFDIYDEKGVRVANVTIVNTWSTSRWEVSTTQCGVVLSLSQWTPKAGVVSELQEWVSGKLGTVNSCERDFRDVVRAMGGLHGLGLDSGEAYRVLDARKESLEKEAGTIMNEVTPFIHRSEDEYQWVVGC